MGFFDFLKKVKAKVSDVFIKIFGKDQAQQFADAALQLMKSAAGTLVLDVVKLVETSNPLLTPADKRQAAFDQIVSDAKSKGLDLTSSIINLLIELAVQTLKNNITA
jgi:hypothetical protein